MTTLPTAHTPTRSTAAPADRLATRFRQIVLAVAMLAILAFGVAEADAAQTLVFALGAAAGWLMTETGSRRGIPRWATTLVLVGVLIGAIVRSTQGTPMVSAFATFIASILVLKLWERREAKDYGQLLALCVFLVIAASLTSASVWLGLAVLAMMPLFAVAVMMYQVIRAGATIDAPRQTADWPAQRRGLLGLTFIALVAGGATACAVFVLIPRNESLGSFMLRMSGPSLGKQTGFTDQVDLQYGGLVSESQAMVMEVSVRTDGTKAPLGSAIHRQYLRGLVLDDYDRGVWRSGVSPEQGRRESRTRGQVLFIAPADRTRDMIEQWITPRLPARNFEPIFGVARVVSADFRGFPGEVEFRVDPVRGTLVHREDNTSPIRYRVRSQPPEDAPAGIWTREPIEQSQWLRLGPLARSALERAGIEPDPARRDPPEDGRAAGVLENFVRGRGTYQRSVPAPPRGKDPTEWFLFESRKGRCEHFASALASLCRSVGIEARVVAGYLASEFDERRGIYIVRQADAHAWVEVRTGEDRWQTYDATPADDLARLAEQRRGPLGSLERWFDSIETTWNTRVALFDSGAQQRLLGLRRAGPEFSNDPAAHLHLWIASLTARDEASGGRSWSWAWWTLGGLAAATAFVVLRRKPRARASRRLVASKDAARALRDLEAALRPHLGPRPEWLPVGRWANPAGPRATAIADEVYAWAFGGVTPDSDALRRVRDAIRKVRSAAK